MVIENANKHMIQVEVAYALSSEQDQVIISVEVPEGANLGYAILQSRIKERFPDIEIQTVKVGIFGRLSKLETIISSGDRIEIYRPLLAEPRDIRRKRAEMSKYTRNR
jgi:putative ubiquitin-RnfH superfamily antitoxin RatB of RatAB toxin-antitoxin module